MAVFLGLDIGEREQILCVRRSGARLCKPGRELDGNDA